jgi:GAF domain-containing protein
LANSSGEVHSAATSADRALRNDEIQQELGDGPCVAAALLQPVVHISDVQAETRWPRWAARAHVELGFGCGICVRLFTHERGIGALNLFSSEPQSFDDDDEQEAVAVAAHAAVALAHAEEIDNLRTAITNRTVIGQATGVVMVQYRLSSLRAFEVLKRLSSEQNRKLAVVAQDVVSDWDAGLDVR